MSEDQRTLVIATTDARLAHAAIEDLVSSGAHFAVLHGEDRLSRLEATSDVDLVADLPAYDLMVAAYERWEARGLFPIVFWPYDVGGTGTIFLANRDASEGVQIDVLHDVRGLGQYGFKSGALLGHVVPGDSFPRLDEEATRVYVARKRQLKGQEGSDRPEVGDLVRELLTPAAAQELSEDSFSSRRSGWSSRARRLVERAVKPVGAWVHIAGDEATASSRAAEHLAARMSRFLPHVGVGQAERLPKMISWWAGSVAPIRWRPGVFISWSASDESSPLGCDIGVRGHTDPDTVAEIVVGELRARLLG